MLLQMLPGFFIFMDQLCQLTGLNFAGPTYQSAWQPAQVIFTLLISALFGLERLTPFRGLGALLAIGGVLCLFLLGCY